MKKTLGILIATILVFTLSLSTFAASFTDVSSNHWAYDAINELAAAGIVEGFPDGTFRPDEPFNREQMAVVVSRILVRLNEEQSALDEKMSEDISSLNDDVTTLQDEVDKLSSGLTTQQAQDVESLVKVLMEKNTPEQDALSEAQAEEVTEMIEKLTQEFQVDIMNLESEVAANAERNDIQFNHLEEQINERYEEITSEITAQVEENAAQAEDNRIELKAQKNINAMKFSDVNDAVDAVEEDVDDVDERVTDIEEKAIQLSGSYAVDYTDTRFAEGEGIEDTDYYWIDDPANYDSEQEYTSDPTGLTEEPEDPIFYSDPWDTDSTEIEENEGEITQTFNMNFDVNTDVFTSTFSIDASSDDDEFDMEIGALTLENDTLKMVYDSANTVNIADYAFSDADVNGVDLIWKDYGIDTFMGIKSYALDETISTEDHDVTYEDANGDLFPIEEEVTKYELVDGTYQPITSDEETDHYVFGARKTFNFAGFNFNTIYAGRHPLDRGDELELDNYLGMNTATDMAGFDLDFDLGYYMPSEGDNGSLMRFGVARDMDLAGVEFNYKNRGENFDPISGDDVIFDDGDDDYDKFTTGLGAADMTGWNFTVQPYVVENMLPGLDAEFFYSSLNDENNVDLTKMQLTGEMDLFLEGLTVDGEYAVVTDSSANDDETTMSVGADYALNDYISGDVNYETVSNVDNNSDENKATTSYGFDVSEYPVIWDLTVSGGYSVENIEDIDNSSEVYDKETTEYNFGLGYTLGEAELGYAYTSKDVAGTFEGTDVVEEGTYTTNTFDMTYAITSNTDITAEYEILNLEDTDGDLNGADDYEVHTATAGVEVSF